MGILSLLPSLLSLSFAGRTDSMFNFYACTSDATRRRPLSFCVLILPPSYTRSPRDPTQFSASLQDNLRLLVLVSPLHITLHIN